MEADMIEIELRGDIEPDDLDELHTLTESDDSTMVQLTSQLSGQSLLKIAVEIVNFGPKILAAFRTIVRADNIKVLKVKTKNMNITVENVNPAHIDVLGNFIEQISKLKS